mmetsp:Transcript_122685/g.343401  ORF Transcript_122685/g.343401 Transcript_122685/m.343401 type:complete len:353 (-) Transcript_122685:1652-2710(-)
MVPVNSPRTPPESSTVNLPLVLQPFLPPALPPPLPHWPPPPPWNCCITAMSMLIMSPPLAEPLPLPLPFVGSDSSVLRAFSSTSCTIFTAASTASGEPLSTTFFLLPSVSTWRSSMPVVERMDCTVTPPLPMMMPPSSHSMSTFFVTTAPAVAIAVSNSALAASTASFLPMTLISCALRSTTMATSCFFSMSRSLLAPLSVSARVAAATTPSMVSELPSCSCDLSISACALSFSSCVPATSSTELSPPLPRRMSCTRAPVDSFMASQRSWLHRRACSPVTLIARGAMDASSTHSFSTTFHLSTSAFSPKRSTPFDLRTTVRPEVSRSSPNLDVGALPPLPFPAPFAAARAPS